MEIYELYKFLGKYLNDSKLKNRNIKKIIIEKGEKMVAVQFSLETNNENIDGYKVPICIFEKINLEGEDENGRIN